MLLGLSVGCYNNDGQGLVRGKGGNGDPGKNGIGGKLSKSSDLCGTTKFFNLQKFIDASLKNDAAKIARMTLTGLLLDVSSEDIKDPDLLNAIKLRFFNDSRKKEFRFPVRASVSQFFSPKKDSRQHFPLLKVLQDSCQLRILGAESGGNKLKYQVLSVADSGYSLHLSSPSSNNSGTFLDLFDSIHIYPHKKKNAFILEGHYRFETYTAKARFIIEIINEATNYTYIDIDFFKLLEKLNIEINQAPEDALKDFEGAKELLQGRIAIFNYTSLMAQFMDRDLKLKPLGGSASK